MCRTGEVYRHCPDCGAGITCAYEMYCQPCEAAYFGSDEDEELENA